MPPHHGGSWKIAYADFMTAMIAFFPVIWLLAIRQPAGLTNRRIFPHAAQGCLTSGDRAVLAAQSRAAATDPTATAL